MPFPYGESTKEKLNSKGWFEENFLAGSAFIYSLILCQKALRQSPPDYWTAGLILALGISILIANISIQLKKRRRIEQELSTVSIVAAQDTLYDIILQNWKKDTPVETAENTSETPADPTKDAQASLVDPKDHGLRICVFHHQESKDSESFDMLEQLTEYTGEDLEEVKAGRKFSGKSGVIGRCVLKGEPAYGRRKSAGDIESFIREMRDDYNYSAKEILELSSDRHSWIAMPIFYKSKLKAVLYCDSKLEDFFGETNGERYNIIVSAALGLARYFRRD